MKAGDFASACPRLEEVVRLEPDGAGAKVKLAECYEGAGRLASAFAMYTIAEASARAAKQADREQWARSRAASLKPRLSTVTIVVEENTAKLPDLVVFRDGMKVGSAQWGTDIPVDGGEIVITAEASGWKAIREVLTVKPEGDTKVFTIVLERQPVMLPPQAEPRVIELTSAPLPAAVQAPAGQLPAVPTWAWVTGGIGILSGLVGIGFRVDGAVIEADQADACGAKRNACPADYDVDGTNARKQRDFALFVGLGVSGAVAAGAAVIGAAVGLTRSGAQTASFEPWLQADLRGGLAGLRGQF